MIRSWMTDLGLTAGPTFALLLFFALFAGLLLWTFRPGSKAYYQRSARLPLDPGTSVESLAPPPRAAADEPKNLTNPSAGE